MSAREVALPDIVGRLHALMRRKHFGQDHEDLVQEVLARAVASGVPLSAWPWLRTVAERIAIDEGRRRRELAGGSGEDLERFSTESRPGPEELTLEAERMAAVRKALDEMPRRYKQALLAWAEHGSPQQVAEHIGATPAATWTLLSRARARLRQELKRAGMVPAMFLRSRFTQLDQPIATGVAAIALAVVATVPSGSAAAQHSAKQPVVKASSGTITALGEQTTSRSSVGTQRTLPSTAAKTEIPVVRPEVHANWEAELCAPGAPKKNYYVRYQDDGRDSPVTMTVLSFVPEELKYENTSQCER